MPRGTPLTPEQLATLGELYAASGNATTVARELGVAISTVTRQLARLGEQGRAKRQSESLAAGMMLGQAYLEVAIETVGEIFVTESEAVAGKLEPDDAQKLVTALARATSALAGLERRGEQRRQAILTRKRTRAETTLLVKKLSEVGKPGGSDPIDASDPRWKALQELVYGAARQGVSANDGPARPDGDPDGMAEG